MGRYQPPRFRKTPHGSELALEYRLMPWLESLGVIISDDGTGMAWHAVCNGQQISGPTSSLTCVVEGAVKFVIAGAELFKVRSVRDSFAKKRTPEGGHRG